MPNAQLRFQKGRSLGECFAFRPMLPLTCRDSSLAPVHVRGLHFELLSNHFELVPQIVADSKLATVSTQQDCCISTNTQIIQDLFPFLFFIRLPVKRC